MKRKADGKPAKKQGLATKTADGPTPSVRWTAPARAKVLPGPTNIPAPLKRLAAKEALLRLGKQTEDSRPRLVAGIAQSDAKTAALVQQVLAAYAKPEVVLTRGLGVDVETIRAVTVGVHANSACEPDCNSWSGSLVRDWEPTIAAALDLWEQAGGLGFAVEVAVRALDYLCFRPKGYEQDQYWIGRCPPDRSRVEWSPVWIALRGRIAAAKPDVYAEAERTAAKLRGRGDAPANCLLSFLFPQRQDWCSEDAAVVIARGCGDYPETHPTKYRETPFLLSSTRDARLAVELAPGFAAPWGVELGWTVVDNLGVEAAPVLAALFKTPNVHRPVSEWSKQCARAMSLIESPVAARFFVDNLKDRAVAAVAVAYLPRVAHWARPALEKAAGKGHAVAKTLLAGLEAAHGRATQSAPKRKVDQVPVDGLPWFLVQPPWAGGAPQPLRRLSLDARPVRIRMATIELTEHGFKDETYEYRISGEDRDSLREWVPKSLADGDQEEYEPSVLEAFTDSEALDLWKRAPVAFWRLNRPESIAGLIERFGEKTLPGLVECARRKPGPMLTALLGTVSKELVEVAAGVFATQKTARPMACAWLARHAAPAATALVPAAVAGDGKSPAALAALRWLSSQGKREVVDEAARAYGKEAADVLAQALSRDEIIEKAKRVRPLPAFWSPSTWARPLLKADRRPLPDGALDHLGVLLRLMPLGVPSPALEAVKAICDRRSLGAFAWDLFGAWRGTGGARDETWAFHALGHLGDEDVVARLAPLIREWPVTGFPSYAATGLDLLAAMGTDAALAELNRVAFRFKSKGLKERAAAKIREVAATRGLTGDELADRIVPQLGLDPDGSRVLDFGRRSFRVGFDDALKPFVKTENGEALADLPKAGKKDGADAPAAAAEWAAMKKEARAVATREGRRLEMALCSQRRWPLSDFLTFLVGHPLLFHVVRRIVWGAWSVDGELRHTFRVSEDRTFADARDRKLLLPPGILIGLPHPLHLPAEEKERWSQLLADYEIEPPFPQIARPVYRRTAAQAALTSVRDLVGVEVATTRLLGLEKRGWTRLDGGGTSTVVAKPIPGTMLQAELTLDPGIFAVISEFPTQKLGPVTVARRGRSPWSDVAPFALGRLSDIAFSELMGDLQFLRG